MRWVIIVFLCFSLLCGSIGLVLPSEWSTRLEEGLQYPVGGSGEKHCDRIDDRETDASLGESCLESEAEIGGSLFSLPSFRRTYFPADLSDILSESIAAKVPAEGETDYRGFAFPDRLPPLTEPLRDEELVYVFRRIVSSATSKVPVNGALEEITFVKEGGRLSVFARVDLGLKSLIERYGITGLPSVAIFCVEVGFWVENAHISVDFDSIHVECESMEVPEALLIFACNLIFGKKDYRRLFGDAVKSVFVNGKIYL